MSPPVFLTDQAYKDVDSSCNWWAENRSAEQAERWYQKLVATIDALKSQPERFAYAEENEKLPVDLRQANFGLGRKLYFDTRLSADNTISCASCHAPENGFAKDTQFGVGIGGQEGGRNSPVA